MTTADPGPELGLCLRLTGKAGHTQLRVVGGTNYIAVIVKILRLIFSFLFPLSLLFPGSDGATAVDVMKNLSSLMLGITATRSREWGIEC